jgi:hypothetical protein
MSTLLDPSTEAAANGAARERGRAPAALPTRPSQAASFGNFWRGAAAKRLRRGGLSAEDAWHAYWHSRQTPKTVGRLCGAEGTPLAWGWNIADAAPECRSLLSIADQLAHAGPDKWTRRKRRGALEDALAQWLEASADGPPTAEFALGGIAAAHVLNELGAALPADQGWELVDFLIATADEARPWSLQSQASGDNVLAQQLLAIELPLVLAYFFAEMGPAPALARSARQRLGEVASELLDGKGLVRSAHLSIQRPLAACWVRCRAVGARVKPRAWSSSIDRPLAAVARQAVRWSDATGRLLLGEEAAQLWTADFLAALLAHGGSKSIAAARKLFAVKSLARSIPRAKQKVPTASYHSEWAGLAVMRSDWSPRAPVVAVDYAGPEFRMEAWSERRRLFHGAWTAEPSVNGLPLAPTGPWEQVCWFSDADVDYLEWSRDLEGGARLERQILLARRDRFLLLADHLQHPEPSSLVLACQWPLASGLQWRAAEESREATLDARKPTARLLPLALPEWRVDPRVGELTHGDGVVRLTQRAAGRALACPLFIDLEPRRLREPCTWRQLTVAEALVIQPDDVAVGYRIQCGRQQWLYYRSQAPCGNRTVLGQNTSNECLIARFLAPSGEIEHLLEIEA